MFSPLMFHIPQIYIQKDTLLCSTTTAVLTEWQSHLGATGIADFMLTVAAFSTKRETFSAKNLDLGHYLGFAHWEVLSIQRLGTDTSTLLTFVIAAKKGVLPTNARSSPNNLELGQASSPSLNPKVGRTYVGTAFVFY